MAAIRSSASSTWPPTPCWRWSAATAIRPTCAVRESSRTIRPVPTQRPCSSHATTWSALKSYGSRSSGRGMFCSTSNTSRRSAYSASRSFELEAKRTR